MHKYVIAFAFLVCSGSTCAVVKCELEKVKGLQIKQTGEVYYVSDSGKRRKVVAGNSVAANNIVQSLALAVDKGLYVQAAFPDSYDCNAPSDVLADWIYVQNPQI